MDILVEAARQLTRRRTQNLAYTHLEHLIDYLVSVHISRQAGAHEGVCRSGASCENSVLRHVRLGQVMGIHFYHGCKSIDAGSRSLYGTYGVNIAMSNN